MILPAYAHDVTMFQTPKPLMEKRRRARFNNCLKHLKTLVMDASRDVSIPHIIIILGVDMRVSDSMFAW